MKKMHDELCQKYSWYEKWHRLPQTRVLHWSLLIMMLVLFANFVLAVGTSSVAEQYVSTQPAVVVKALSSTPFFGSAAQVKLSEKAVKALRRHDEDKSLRRYKITKVNTKLLEDTSTRVAPLSLELFDGKTITIDKMKMDNRAGDNYTWYGKIREFEKGEAVLTVVNGQLAGQVTLVDEVTHTSGTYTIESVDGELYTLQEHDYSNIPDHPELDVEADAESDFVTTMSAPDIATQTTTTGGTAQGDTADFIDIMVVYSNQTAAAAGTAIGAQIQSAIDVTNNTFANTGITTRLRLAYAGSIGYDESGDFYTDLDRITSGSDGYVDQVQTMRNTYAADLVTLFVENGQYCGLGWIGPSPSYAFTVVNRGCAGGNLSLAHELGHNFGALHDPYVDPSTSPYAYGHGYANTTAGWRTVMAYNNACAAVGKSCTRIGYWASPNVTYGGLPTGTAENGGTPTSDDARVMSMNAGMVANFKLLSGTSCAHTNPTISVAPATQNGSAGQSLTYNITVANKDDSACAGSTFVVTPTLPAGLMQIPSTLSMTLEPGTQQTQSVVLTSEGSSVPATFTFTEAVRNLSVTGTYGASATANYVIMARDTTPPMVSITSPANGTVLSSRKVNIQASASDASGIARIELFVDGKLMRTCSSVTSCTYSWTYSRATAGAHTIKAVAIDKSTNANRAETTISVTKK